METPKGVLEVVALTTVALITKVVMNITERVVGTQAAGPKLTQMESATVAEVDHFQSTKRRSLTTSMKNTENV